MWAVIRWLLNSPSIADLDRIPINTFCQPKPMIPTGCVFSKQGAQDYVMKPFVTETDHSGSKLGFIRITKKLEEKKHLASKELQKTESKFKKLVESNIICSFLSLMKSNDSICEDDAFLQMLSSRRDFCAPWIGTMSRLELEEMSLCVAAEAHREGIIDPLKKNSFKRRRPLSVLMGLRPLRSIPMELPTCSTSPRRSQKLDVTFNLAEARFPDDDQMLSLKWFSPALMVLPIIIMTIGMTLELPRIGSTEEFSFDTIRTIKLALSQV